MGSYTVIADISRSIIELLRAGTTPEPISKKELIGLAGPVEAGAFLLCLNLYNIEENPDMRSQERILIDSDHTKDPPMSLTLYYMLYVNIQGDPAGKAVDEQRILGRAVQQLNDNRRVPQEFLLPSLKELGESVDIMNVNLTMEEKTRIWTLYNQPYRLSMFYKVGPVFLESTNIVKAKRVKELEIKAEQRKWL